jgi:hypothetical protein
MHWSGTGSGLGGLEAGPNGMRLSSSSLKLSSTLAFRTRVLRIGLDLDFSSSSGSSSNNLWLSSGPPRIFLGPHRGTVFTSIFLPSFFCSDYYYNSRHHYHVCKYDRLRTFSIKMFLIKKLKKVTFQKKKNMRIGDPSHLFSRSFLLSTKCLTIKLNWFCCRQCNMKSS